MKRSKEGVVFIFVKPEEREVFMEVKPGEMQKPEFYSYTSGHIEPQDYASDPETTRLNALEREIQEELGVYPTGYTRLIVKDSVQSLRGTLLFPYVVDSYEGELPTAIKDNGNPTKWVKIEEARQSKLYSVRLMTAGVEQYIHDQMLKNL
jgi:8-oxo-dGTP pyrophosphatase MutT (NUDIX family)